MKTIFINLDRKTIENTTMMIKDIELATKTIFLYNLVAYGKGYHYDDAARVVVTVAYGSI